MSKNRVYKNRLYFHTIVKNASQRVLVTFQFNPYDFIERSGEDWKYASNTSCGTPESLYNFVSCSEDDLVNGLLRPEGYLMEDFLNEFSVLVNVKKVDTGMINPCAAYFLSDGTKIV